jgi:hypothetical protein
MGMLFAICGAPFAVAVVCIVVDLLRQTFAPEGV